MGITRVAVAGLLAVCLQAGAVTAQEYLIAVAAAEPQPGLYAMKSDGTDRRLVQAGGLTLLRPDSWSPDGGTLLYLSASQEFSVGKPLPMHFPLVAVDTNGRQPRLVADFPVTPMFGWAADSRFVFVVSGFEDSDPPPPPGKEWFPKVAVRDRRAVGGANSAHRSWRGSGSVVVSGWADPGVCVARTGRSFNHRGRRQPRRLGHPTADWRAGGECQSQMVTGWSFDSRVYAPSAGGVGFAGEAPEPRRRCSRRRRRVWADDPRLG